MRTKWTRSRIQPRPRTITGFGISCRSRRKNDAGNPRMIATLHASLPVVAFITVLELTVMVRILVRPHRDPASRIAWIVVVAALPLMGMIAYLFLGEVNIGRSRVKRLHAVLERMPQIPLVAGGDVDDAAAAVPERYRHLFSLGHSISGFPPVIGNSARLLSDSNAAIDAIVADIDSATDHVHVLFYIWLPDHNGTKVVEALNRAAARGVTCRVMADDLGSRTIIHSGRWQAMRTAGVRVAAGLPIGNPLISAPARWPEPVGGLERRVRPYRTPIGKLTLPG